MAKLETQEMSGETATEQAMELMRSKVFAVTAGKLFQTQPALATAQLVLTTDSLRLYGETAVSPQREYMLEDLIGVNVSHLPPQYSQAACQLDVHLYPLVKKSAKKISRKMEVLSVGFDVGETFKDNLKVATEWKNAIKLQSRRRVVKIFQHADHVEVTEESVLVPRHLLVFINPMGGPGKAVAEFTQHVQPLFDLAEINYNIVVTERQNHAYDLMKDYDVSSIDGIAIASGDGLLYEVVNGLMERDDWEEAVKTPIGMLPTGSGNALCASTLHEAGEEFSLVNAAFQIIRGGVVPMDIATVETADKKPMYMTLLGSWGLVADIDIESEKLRRIGDTRFVVGALNCIRKKKIYRGRLTYLPYDGPEDDAYPLSKSVPTSPTIPMPAAEIEMVTTSLNPKLLAQAMRREEEEEETCERERSDSQDVFASADDVLLEESSIGPGMGLKEREKGGGDSGGCVEADGERDGEKEEKSKEVVDEKEDSWELVKGGKVEPDEGAKQETEPAAIPKLPDSLPLAIQGQVSATPRSINRRSSGPDPHLLPELEQSTPETWKTVEGEFLSITPLMVSHMSRAFVGDPKMSIGTGKIRILYIQKLSRFGLLGMLTGGEQAKHLEMSEVKVVDVKAYRLEPFTERGLMTVDGEVVKYGPIQAQVHQHLARVFCRKRVSQEA